MLYLLSSPCWQNGRFGHSGGPPRTVSFPLHLLAKSDRVFSEYLSAVAFVTAKAFWSAALAASPKVRPFLSPSPLTAVAVAFRSLDAAGDGLGPFALPCTEPAGEHAASRTL